jgi:hypothetical protein
MLIERLMSKRPSGRPASANEVRSLLLKWAAADKALPLDVDPTQDAAKTIAELEESHKAEASVWDAMPLVIFADKGSTSTSVGIALPTTEQKAISGVSGNNDVVYELDDEPLTPSGGTGRWFTHPILLVSGMLVAICALVWLMELVRG